MSFAGTGTVQPNWQQAVNLITQQSSILVSELVEAERKRKVAERMQEEAQAALMRYKEQPVAYTEGWYVKELGKERERRQKLESDLRRAHEFMRLKDQAKIKVEKARDEAQRKLKAQISINTLLRTKAQKVDDLTEMNQRQAEAFLGHERMLSQKESEVRRLREENVRLMDIIKLGRRGLDAEMWDKEERYIGR